MTKTERLEQLFKEWEEAQERESPQSLARTMRGNNITASHFRRDGIIDETTFENERVKVLFVSYEANDDEYSAKITPKTNTVNDYREYYDSGIERYRGQMKERTSEYYKIFSNTPREDLSNSDAALHYAIMDLNKRGGQKNINDEHVLEYCRVYNEYIKEEIEIIDPDVIVCMGDKPYTNSIFALFGAKMSGGKKYITVNNRLVPVIVVWHTAYRFGFKQIEPLPGYNKITGSLCAKCLEEARRYNLV